MFAVVTARLYYGPNINTIGDDNLHDVADDDDYSAAAVILTDNSGPRLLVGNTTIAVCQSFDGLPELMLCFALASYLVRQSFDGLSELMLCYASFWRPSLVVPPSGIDAMLCFGDVFGSAFPS